VWCLRNDRAIYQRTTRYIFGIPFGENRITVAGRCFFVEIIRQRDGRMDEQTEEQSGQYLLPRLAELARGEKVHVLKHLSVVTARQNKRTNRKLYVVSTIMSVAVQSVTPRRSSAVAADIVFHEDFVVTVTSNAETPATSSTAKEVSPRHCRFSLTIIFLYACTVDRKS